MNIIEYIENQNYCKFCKDKMKISLEIELNELYKNTNSLFFIKEKKYKTFDNKYFYKDSDDFMFIEFPNQIFIDEKDIKGIPSKDNLLYFIRFISECEKCDKYSKISSSELIEKDNFVNNLDMSTEIIKINDFNININHKTRFLILNERKSSKYKIFSFDTLNSLFNTDDYDNICKRFEKIRSLL